MRKDEGNSVLVNQFCSRGRGGPASNSSRHSGDGTGISRSDAKGLHRKVVGPVVGKLDPACRTRTQVACSGSACLGNRRPRPRLARGAGNLGEQGHAALWEELGWNFRRAHANDAYRFSRPRSGSRLFADPARPSRARGAYCLIGPLICMAGTHARPARGAVFDIVRSARTRRRLDRGAPDRERLAELNYDGTPGAHGLDDLPTRRGAIW